MGSVRTGEDAGPGPLERRGSTVVHVGRSVEGDARVAVFGVVPGKEPLAERAGILDRAEPGREAGRYLRVLKWASEYGLSLLVCGRLWLLTMPRSARSSATGFDAIELPRSAWMVSSPGSMPCLSTVSAMSRCARTALSRVATIQPGT
jgi:hypothetical protein